MSEPTERPTLTPGAVPTDATGTFSDRLVRALKLDAELYEEVEHDPYALRQAAFVVGLAALASAIGALGWLGVGGILAGLVSAFITWIVWTALVWAIGVKAYGHTSDFEELLRTLGFVAAPQLLNVLLVIPIGLVQGLVGIVVLVMTLIAFVRATRQALDVDTTKALIVAGLGVLAYAILGMAFGVSGRF